MKIEFGDYILESEPYNFILSKKVTVKKGKHKGENTLEVEGYYLKLEDAFESLLNKKLKKVMAKNLEELRIELLDMKKEFRAYLKEIDIKRD